MCMGGSPSTPSAPPPPPAPVPAPQLPDQGVQQAGKDQRAKAAAAASAGQTLLTGPQGLTEQAQTTGKSLLGS